MPLINDIRTYRLEIEWLLTWFPLHERASIDKPRMRGGTIRHLNSDPTFAIGNRDIVTAGQKLNPNDEELAPNGSVVAFIDIGVAGPLNEFDVAIQVNVGGSSQRRHLLVPPDRRIPLMINVPGHRGDELFRDTAAVFQAVVTTGHRITLLDLLTSVAGP